MDINTFIKTCSNKHVKALVIKLLKQGGKLIVSRNSSTYIVGKYIVRHGGFTITKL